jgi:hypothetical protein
VINLILAPLVQWVGVVVQEVKPADNVAVAHTPLDRWQPSRPPLPVSEQNVVQSDAAPDSLENQDCEVVTDAAVIKPLAAEMRPKNPRLVSQRRWADLEDDSDEDGQSP